MREELKGLRDNKRVWCNLRLVGEASSEPVSQSVSQSPGALTMQTSVYKCMQKKRKKREREREGPD